MSDLDRELESELHRLLDPMSSLPIPPRRSPRHRASARAILGGAGAALSLKVLTGVAVAAAAVTVAGAATTGTFDPVHWGRQVTQYVSDCKAKLNDGQHGIGDCVAPLASLHGKAVSSAARQHGAQNANGHGANGNDNGSGNANAHAKSKTHPSPKPGDRSAATTDPEPVDPAGGHPPVTITPQP